MAHLLGVAVLLQCYIELEFFFFVWNNMGADYLLMQQVVFSGPNCYWSQETEVQGASGDSCFVWLPSASCKALPNSGISLSWAVFLKQTKTLAVSLHTRKDVILGCEQVGAVARHRRQCAYGAAAKQYFTWFFFYWLVPTSMRGCCSRHHLPPVLPVTHGSHLLYITGHPTRPPSFRTPLPSISWERQLHLSVQNKAILFVWSNPKMCRTTHIEPLLVQVEHQTANCKLQTAPWCFHAVCGVAAMGFAVRVRSAGQKYGPTCHQRDRADVTEFVTLVRLSSLGQHVGALALAGYKRRKSALAAGPIWSTVFTFEVYCALRWLFFNLINMAKYKFDWINCFWQNSSELQSAKKKIIDKYYNKKSVDGHSPRRVSKNMTACMDRSYDKTKCQTACPGVMEDMMLIVSLDGQGQGYFILKGSLSVNNVSFNSLLLIYFFAFVDSLLSYLWLSAGQLRCQSLFWTLNYILLSKHTFLLSSLFYRIYFDHNNYNVFNILCSAIMYSDV